MRMAVRFSVAVAAVTLALVTGACGGGSSKSVTASSPTTAMGGSTTTAKPAAGPSNSATAVSSDKVDIKGYAFNAGNTEVKAGTTVTWTNEDAFQHSVVDDGGAFTGPAIDPQKTFSHTFAQPGTFSYHCGIHNYMTGKITVTP